jgi:parvulin-like peptidyl-prolyl isomerase
MAVCSLTGAGLSHTVIAQMKRLAFCWLLILGVAAARAQTAQDLMNGIAVIVNDKVITVKDVRMAIQDDADFLQRRYRGQPQVFDEKMKQLMAEALERMVDDNLVLHEFRTLGRPLPESYIENRINEEIKTKFGDRLTMIKTLQAGGLTYESYRERIRERTILQLMWNMKVPRDPVISPTKIENYYNANPDKFKLEDRVKLRMIVLTNRPNDTAYAPLNLAREIAKKVDEGTSFAEMAKIYSQGSQASEGGDWGWVEKKVLREDLAKVAFSLKPGTRSEPLETPSGVYLMFVEESEVSHVRGLSEVRDEIENTLKAEETKRLHQQYVDRLKKKSFVRYF